MNKRILIIEDERNIIELLKYNLSKEGYLIDYIVDGENVLEKIQSFMPDLLILDLMLPGKDGFEICKELSEQDSTNKIPIIIMSAKSREFEKVLALDFGADDYICKPFSIKEFVARVNAIFRRMKKVYGENENKIKFGNIIVDYKKREVFKDDFKLYLTLKEFELLVMFINNKGRILTRELILNNIWGYNYVGETRTVDVHVRYLRRKIEDDDKKPRYIETVRGLGYKFNYD